MTLSLKMIGTTNHASGLGLGHFHRFQGHEHDPIPELAGLENQIRTSVWTIYEVVGALYDPTNSVLKQEAFSSACPCRELADNFYFYHCIQLRGCRRNQPDLASRLSMRRASASQTQAVEIEVFRS